MQGFQNQNNYEKIDKNQQKNIKIAKHYRQGGHLAPGEPSG